MIIWLNGSFGSGKSSVALELQSMFEDAHIYDPEEVGQFIRANVPGGNEYTDFQDHPLWRKLNYEVLKHTSKTAKAPVIVPMTIVNDSYHNEIITKLKDNDIDVRLYSLIASETTLHNRLLQRGDEMGAWSYEQVSRCCDYLSSESYSTKIDSEKYSINEVAEIIFNLLND